MEKRRILWMDIAKAAGILVVLLVHTGISLGPVTFFGGMFYMPVFFVLAGMTFSFRKEETFCAFVRKKAKRLLLPYGAFNLFLFAFFFLKDSVLTGQITKASFFPLAGILYSRNCLFPPDTADNIYLMQILNAPTWFLTGMFTAYVIFWVIQRAAKGEIRAAVRYTAYSLAAAAVLHYFCPILLPWSMDCALYAVAFMTAGKWAAEKNAVEWLYRRPWAVLLTAALFAVLSWLNGSVNMSVASYGRSMLVYLAVGTAGSLLVMTGSLFLERHGSAAAKMLGFLGRHTLPVLCLHLFVYSVIGTVLRFLGIG